MRKLVLLIFSVLVIYLAINISFKHKEKSSDNILMQKFGPLDSEKILYIYNWVDYLPLSVAKEFEKITGIKVIIDVFDCNEILEAKLLTGNSGYDLVFPTAWPYFSRQMKIGAYQPIDLSRISLRSLDKDILKKLQKVDPENKYAIPYLWGVEGIGINTSKVTEFNELPKSWALVFNPNYAAKLKKYNIELFESPGELFPAALAYLGMNPESDDINDLEKAAKLVESVRPYITKFNASAFQDLASENSCIVLGTSGDIRKAGIQLSKKNKTSNIKFIFPEEGAALWLDVMAIPKYASHPNNANAFIAFILQPENIAAVTNANACANAVVTSKQYVSDSLRNDPMVYPTKDMRNKCYIEQEMPPSYESLRMRILTKIKSNQ